MNLLLRAIPADQQQALITARELTSTALLFRLLVRYQPGGAGEKSILLSKLTTTLDKATGATDLAAALALVAPSLCPSPGDRCGAP